MGWSANMPRAIFMMVFFGNFENLFRIKYRIVEWPAQVRGIKKVLSNIL